MINQVNFLIQRRSTRGTYVFLFQFIQILLKENEEMKKKFQLYEEGPEPYHFEHQKE